MRGAAARLVALLANVLLALGALCMVLAVWLDHRVTRQPGR